MSTTAFLNIARRAASFEREWSARLYAPTEAHLFAWIRFGLWLAEAFPLSVEAVHVGRLATSGRRSREARLFVRVRR